MATDFEPIDHKNQEFLIQSLKDALIDVKSTDMQKRISAILQLSNHVEYLARDLIRNLRRLTKVSTHNKFKGIFFWPFDHEEDNLKKMTLGNLIKELGEFSFPDRGPMLGLLGQFNGNRIKLIHKLLDEPPDETLIVKITEDFENIFVRYRVIQDAIKEVWPV